MLFPLSPPPSPGLHGGAKRSPSLGSTKFNPKFIL